MMTSRLNRVQALRKVPAHTICAMLHSSAGHNYAVTMFHSALRN